MASCSTNRTAQTVTSDNRRMVGAHEQSNSGQVVLILSLRSGCLVKLSARVYQYSERPTSARCRARTLLSSVRHSPAEREGGKMKIIPGGLADKLGMKFGPNWSAMKVAAEVTDEDVQKAIDEEKITYLPPDSKEAP